MALPTLSPVMTVVYPDTDGLPMAETDFQRKPLTYAVDALDIYFEKRPEVYVSGNLLIYYEENNPQAVAPSLSPRHGPSCRRPRLDRQKLLSHQEAEAAYRTTEQAERASRQQAEQARQQAEAQAYQQAALRQAAEARIAELEAQTAG